MEGKWKRKWKRKKKMIERKNIRGEKMWKN